MKRLRRVTEAEVISEFLRNEFYSEEFQHDRTRFESLVLEPDLGNEHENAVRRALLFRRRGHMWRELPTDTAWWQVQLEADDLRSIRVFPRAHWRTIGKGSFHINNIVNNIRRGRFHGRTRSFVSKIQALSYRLRLEHDNSSVLLIGVDEARPLTILEGNHRLAAALLASRDVFAGRFRVLCGLSPHMTESCWYETNLANLWRYARNRFRNLRDREADVDTLWPQPEPAHGYLANAATLKEKL
ncbi:MAG TPA: hypothetical protein VFA60_09285 [Terriglobales bacterium]|nr:hypothetical protein [Terriglobales bacterium]